MTDQDIASWTPEGAAAVFRALLRLAAAASPEGVRQEWRALEAYAERTGKRQLVPRVRWVIAGSLPGDSATPEETLADRDLESRRRAILDAATRVFDSEVIG